MAAVEHANEPTDDPPTLDARGYRRSKATFPGYGRGRPSRNKGRKFPAEILGQDEIAALMDAPWREPLMELRNRAMLALMYRAEVKIGALLKLAIRDYNESFGVLTVPGSHGGPAYDVRLDPECRSYLDGWLQERAKLRLRPSAPIFCTLKGTQGRPIRAANFREILTDHGQRVGIQRRVTPEGLRKSRQHHRQTELGRFEATLVEYINAETFRRRYSAAYQKWTDAHQLLEIAPDRYATTIGHLCREAIAEFSDELALSHHVGSFEALKTKAKMRAVFASEADLSRTVRKSLEALLAYWETVSDLANRQEHSHALVVEDSRRLVFQTMLVMREIDSALHDPLRL
jgi:hypothetical protein